MKYLPVRILEAYKRLSCFLHEIYKTTKPRLVYAGGYLGKQNLGDESFLVSYKKVFNKCDIIHYPSASRVLKIPCKLLAPSQSAVLAGGTLINRHEFYLRVMQECSALFPNSFIFGSGVADPIFWTGRPNWENKLKAWKPLLERCRYIGVRGPRSKEILSEIGIKADIIGDPVLALSDIEMLQKASVEPYSIGFNIGHDGNVWGSEENIKKEFIQLAILAKKAGWKIKWFVVWPKDRETTLQVAHASGTESEVFQIYNDPIDFLNLVRSLSVFVGMKLHSVILATCAYVPSVMLEYRPKCRDYMRSIEQDAFTVNTQYFNSENVWNLVNNLNVLRDYYSQTLAEKISYFRDKQIKKASELMQNA